MAQDSLELVLRLQAGDRQALETLIERHLPGLRGYVRLRSGPHLRAKEASTDLVQSVCREVLGNLDRFQYPSEGAFRNWLYATALRKIKNRYEYWRAAKRDSAREQPYHVPVSQDSDASVVECYASLCTPSRQLQAKETMERIESAFDELPEGQREVVILSRIVGLSHSRIAEHTGRSEVAVRSLLSRGLARLVDRLAVEGGSP